jgi:tripartite-type tricarboxylate transporter receptor subunit TctC
MKKRLEADSVEPVGRGPEQLLNAIKRDVEKWKRVVKEAKITVTS